MSPVAWVEGEDSIVERLKQIVKKARSHWRTTDPETVREWEEFARKYPDSNNVQDFINLNPSEYKLPLDSYLKLLNRMPFKSTGKRSQDDINIDDLAIYRNGNSITTSRNLNPENPVVLIRNYGDIIGTDIGAYGIVANSK